LPDDVTRELDRILRAAEGQATHMTQ
jgi:hypothetical protein